MSNSPDQPTYDELLHTHRLSCRDAEVAQYKTEGEFRYDARMIWWRFLEESQLLAEHIMPFREFWACEDTYPRTIAVDPR